MTDNYKAAERIMEIYDGMKPDGTLVLPAFNNVIEEKDQYLFCKMVWTKDEAVSLCGEINDLIDHFRNLSGRYSELENMDEEQLKSVLPKEELEIWLTYRPLDDHGLKDDQVQDYYTEDRESELRVGKGIFARRVVEGGTRVLKCLVFEAPKIVMEYVVSVFVKAVILHRFCKECVLTDRE